MLVEGGKRTREADAGLSHRKNGCKRGAKVTKVLPVTLTACCSSGVQDAEIY